MPTAIEKITTRAKAIRKKKPAIKWLTAIKEASAEYRAKAKPARKTATKKKPAVKHKARAAPKKKAVRKAKAPAKKRAVSVGRKEPHNIYKRRDMLEKDIAFNLNYIRNLKLLKPVNKKMVADKKAIVARLKKMLTEENSIIRSQLK